MARARSIVLIPLVTLLATISQGSVYEASADVLINRQEADDDSDRRDARA